MSRARGYTFTSYKGSAPIFDTSKMVWMIVAPEMCPTTGRPHWQGFVYWKNACSMSACIKRLGGNISVFVKAKHATFADQVAYIRGPYAGGAGKPSKPENPECQEYGEMPEQGSRSDLRALCSRIMAEELKVEDILLDDPNLFHQYGRTFQATEDLMRRKRRRTCMTKGLWLWGLTGTGKSHHAWSVAPHGEIYRKMSDTAWWDGYDGQMVVLLDEFRGEMKYHYLLQLLDKYPVSVPVKYRDPVPFTSERIIITAPLPPAGIYKGQAMKEDPLAQLYRRCDVVECYIEDGEYKRRATDVGVEEMHGIF